MTHWIKLGVYVAAGVGTYEVLRRYGLLQKAGSWLSKQVPDEYKEQAGEYYGQLRERAGQVGGRVHDLADQATEAVRGAAGYGAVAASNTAGNGNAASHTGGAQNLTGTGRGTSAVTEDTNGTHVPHTVGRGVIR